MREDDELKAWRVPPPPDGLVDRVMGAIDGTGVHAARGAAEPPAKTRSRRVIYTVAIAAAGAAAAAALTLGLTRRGDDGRPTTAAARAGELSAAAPSVVAIAPGTTIEADAGAVLRWRLDEAGVVRVIQDAGAVTYRHEPGAHLVVDTAWVAVTTDEAFFRVEAPMTENQKRAAVVGATGAVAAAIAVVVYTGDAGVSNSHGAVEARAGDVVLAVPGEAPAVSPPDTVARQTVTEPRRLPDAAARAELRDAITRARAARELKDRVAGLNAAAGAGDVDRPVIDRDTPGSMEKDEIRSAVREVVPMLAECYGMIPELGAGAITVEMTVSGEPGVGTAIDDAAVTEGDTHMTGNAEFTECITETLMSVEMPPLTAGGSVIIRYPFMFADSEEEADELDDSAEDTRTGTTEKAAVADKDAPPPSGSVEALLEQAHAASRAGKYVEAMRFALAVLQQAPDNVQAHTVMAIGACNTGNGALAATHLSRLGDGRAGMIRQICLRHGVELP